MARNVIDVINKLKPIFEEQKLNTVELDSIISSKQFAPPELDYLHWQRLNDEIMYIAKDYLNKDISEFPEWLKQISEIILDKE